MLRTKRTKAIDGLTKYASAILGVAGLVGFAALAHSSRMGSLFSEDCDQSGIDPTKPCSDGIHPPTYWNQERTVFQSYTWDFAGEVKHMQEIMKLEPGMTYCEMGAGNGLFFAQMAKKVMPGGKAYGTSPSPGEVAQFQKTAIDLGIPKDAVAGTLATNEPAFLGLPPNTCDRIYSRMVYHMIPAEPARAYQKQLGAALKKDGMLFFTDHDPDNDKWVRGEATVLPFEMQVVPMAVEIEEFKAAGFTLQRVIRNWPYFGDSKTYGEKSPDEMGYGLIWTYNDDN